MNRSPTFERQMLEEVARAAGLWGADVERFNDAVAERLRQGEVEYEADNPALERPVPDVLREIGEEGTDVVAWSLLAAQSLHQLALDGMDADAVHEAQAHIIAASAYGMRLWAETREAIKAVKTAKAHAGWREHARPVTCGG